jgi:ATP-binding cassette subfamily C protein PrsD
VALLQAIEDIQARGGIVVLIAHRAGMLSVCDKLLVLRDGTQYAFGQPDDILGRVTRQPSVAATTRLKIVASAPEKLQ